MAGRLRVSVPPVTEQSARDFLDLQLAECHRHALEFFSQRSEANLELDTLASGLKLRIQSDTLNQYAPLLQSAGSLDNAAFAVERALLTGDFACDDYADVPPVNIPKVFASVLVPDLATDAGDESEDEMRVMCGL
jgi:hypothetical protein